MFVCILPEKAVPEMTCTVSGRTLNPTHSLTLLKLVGLTEMGEDWTLLQGVGKEV